MRLTCKLSAEAVRAQPLNADGWLWSFHLPPTLLIRWGRNPAHIYKVSTLVPFGSICIVSLEQSLNHLVIGGSVRLSVASSNVVFITTCIRFRGLLLHSLKGLFHQKRWIPDPIERFAQWILSSARFCPFTQLACLPSRLCQVFMIYRA